MVEDSLLYCYEKFSMDKNLVRLLGDQKKQNFWFSLLVAFNLILAFILIISPVTSIKGAEPNVIYTIQRTMLNTEWMYQDPESIPFSATQYTPFYYMICSTAGELLSLIPGEDVVDIYRTSRSISFFAAIMIGYFIFQIIHQVYNVNRMWSYWIALSCVLCTVPWYYAVRPDALMALFFFATLYFFGRYQKNDRRSNQLLIFAGICGALSFLSKQNGLIISVVIGSFLLFQFRLKALGIFTAGFITGVLFFSILFYPFYTEFFFEHLLQGPNNGINVKNAINIVYYSLISRFGTLSILAFLIAFILYLEFSHKNIADELKFIIYLLIVTFLFSTATALKIGSDINYFHEVISVSLILLCKGCIMIGDRYKISDQQVSNIFVFCVAFAFCSSLTLSGFLGVGLRNITRLADTNELYDYEILKFLKEIEMKNPGTFYMLADEAFIVNSLPKQNVVPHADIASLWYTRKIYDYTKLKTGISSGEISIYVGNGPKLSIFDIDLESNFSLLRTINGHNVYMNKNSAKLKVE
jgi:hypothetical protein